MNLHTRHIALLLCLLSASNLRAQYSAPTAATESIISEEKQLPDIHELMREVEIHQRQAELVERDYFFKEDSTLNERNSSGGIKKVEERAFEIYWLQGVRVARLVRKDSKDLSPDELKKEDERIDKEVAKEKEKRAKADAQGKETDSAGRDEITLSRILELGSFSNPRRQVLDGRSTILIDYTGDPHAKTRNPGEAAMKVLAGTIWVDEQDKALMRGEGHFFDDFKLGGGLVVNIHKDTAFTFTNVRINNEVWLPGTLDAHGQARYLLFFSLNGDAHIRSSGYRKFKATSTLLPNFSPAPADTPPEPVPAPPR